MAAAASFQKREVALHRVNLQHLHTLGCPLPLTLSSWDFTCFGVLDVTVMFGPTGPYIPTWNLIWHLVLPWFMDHLDPPSPVGVFIQHFPQISLSFAADNKFWEISVYLRLSI